MRKTYGRRGDSHGHGPVLRLRASPSSPTRGLLRAGPLRIPCAIGRGGLTARKREGDGGTPLGCLRVLSAFRRRGRMPALRLALAVRWVHPARDGWCDAPTHGAYNRLVRLPFPAGHERLARADRLYDAGLVLDWNVSRRARGLGSAIFLHVAREGLAPTEGCIALLPRDLLRLGPLLRRGTRLQIGR